MRDNRAGTFIDSQIGYSYFSPKKLPPDPPIEYDSEMINLLSIADRKLGRLDGITQILPNPELFVAMYVRKEAVLSSQIEGTQASLSDVLNREVKPEKREEVNDVVNYVNAMNYGLQRLKDFPLSLRLIREIHAELLRNGRGSTRNPGEFRKTQNWIGPANCTLNEATFVPPTVPVMNEALGDLEIYLHKESDIPALIKIALVHAQFESIHPFLDGNGRMGRLLITFWLCQQGILSQPLLYLSYYFKKYRLDYYDYLMDVRNRGNWESWIKFFLKGVSLVSDEATNAAKDIMALKSKYEKLLSGSNTNSLKLLDILFEFPYVDKNMIAAELSIAAPTAGKLVTEFCNYGILADVSPSKQRYKQYAFKEYLDILNRGTEI